MGFGYMIMPYKEMDNPINKVELNRKIMGNPSSNIRAELSTIIITLSLTKREANIHLVTDSNSVISSIKRYISTSIYRKTNRYKCGLLLEVIKEILREKELTLHLYKIQVHTGDPQNEKVNKMA